MRLWQMTMLALSGLALMLSAGCDNDPYPSDDVVFGNGAVVQYRTLREDPKSFDPVRASDNISNACMALVYDTLFQYNYLDRPIKLECAMAETMPETFQEKGPDGTEQETVLLTIKKGLYYHPDACFELSPEEEVARFQQAFPVEVAAWEKKHGEKPRSREVTAEDFVLSIKRLCDGRNRSEGFWTLSEKVEGIDDFQAQSVSEIPTDYGAPISGVEVLDRYRFRLHLVRPFPQLKYIFAMYYTAPIPWEAVEEYTDPTNHFFPHPKGAGLCCPFVVRVGPEFADSSRLPEAWRQRLFFSPIRKKNEAGDATLEAVLLQVKGVLHAEERETLKKMIPDPALIAALDNLRPGDLPHRQSLFVRENRTLGINPVTSGPYHLNCSDWIRARQMLYRRNPFFREEYYPSTGEEAHGTPGDPDYYKGDEAAGLLRWKGQRLPLTDGIRTTIIHDSNPGWRLFLQGYLDSSGIGKDSFDKAIRKQDLSPEMRALGIGLTKETDPTVFMMGMNMQDAVVGKNLALRRAICCAYDFDLINERFFNGRFKRANELLPEDIFGARPEHLTAYALNLEKARAYLKEAGYENGCDANGDRLTLFYDTTGGSSSSEQMAQTVAQMLAPLGIDVKLRFHSWQELQKIYREGRWQLTSVGWNADYPDPENFMLLFYGPNKSPGPGTSNYENKEFDTLFEKMRGMEDGPERAEIIHQMSDILERDAVCCFENFVVSWSLRHKWRPNYKANAFVSNGLKYMALDRAMREEYIRKMNVPNPLPVVWVILGCIALGFLLARFRFRKYHAIKSSQKGA